MKKFTRTSFRNIVYLLIEQAYNAEGKLTTTVAWMGQQTGDALTRMSDFFAGDVNINNPFQNN